MYYGWKASDSTAAKGKYFITDYDEKDDKGRVWVDGFGHLEVILVASSKNKFDVIQALSENFSK